MNKGELIRKSKDIRKGIVKNINLFNKFKEERNKINVIVKENKVKRQVFVNQMKVIISKIKELNQQKGDVNFSDIKRLKDLIEKKEWFFQINALPIKKEEKILKEIKDLRSELKKSKKNSDILYKLRGYVKELESIRKKHNELHNIVVNDAEKSNGFSGEMKVVQKEIKNLKKEGKKINAQLKEILTTQDIKKKENKKRNETNKRKKESIIKTKQAEVLSKLKNKKKLTTDDLIFFQK